MKTMRGDKVHYWSGVVNGDPWTSRIQIAPNSDPANVSKPFMRMDSLSKPIGGFYVPAGYHLKILLGEKGKGGGWFSAQGCPGTACQGIGTSLWVTTADAYSYPNRDPLLLIEPNVNAWDHSDPLNFERGTIWFDVSAVDGINVNLQLKYGKIDRSITVPLV